MNYRGVYFVRLNGVGIGLDVFDTEYVKSPTRRKRINKFITEYARSAGFKDMRDYLAHFPGHKDNEKPEWSDDTFNNTYRSACVQYGSEDLKHPVEIYFGKIVDSDTPSKQLALSRINTLLRDIMGDQAYCHQMIKFPIIANMRPYCIDYEFKGTRDGELWFCRDWTPDMYKCNNSKS